MDSAHIGKDWQKKNRPPVSHHDEAAKVLEILGKEQAEEPNQRRRRKKKEQPQTPDGVLFQTQEENAWALRGLGFRSCFAAPQRVKKAREDKQVG